MLLPKIDIIVSEMLNPMKCFVDLKSPTLQGDRFENSPSKCSKSSTECEIKNFFRDNLSDFSAVLSKFKNTPNATKDTETKNREVALNKIIKKRINKSSISFSNKSQDEKYCWACSDAIHAVLAPKGSLVVNRNGRHYDMICESIGRISRVYSSPKV